MINKTVFLEKYPFFKESKDELVAMGNLKGGRIVHFGYIIDEYFVPYSDYFCFHGTMDKEINWIDFRLIGSIVYLGARFPNINCQVKFDLDNIQPKENYIEGEIGGGGRGIQQFDIDKVLEGKEPLLSEKNRVNPKFDDFYKNKIHKTEFYYQPSDHSLSIEEVTDNLFNGEYINRYLHTKFDPIKKVITHFDGSFNFYDSVSKELRKQTTLDKKSKLGYKHIKLFRLDGDVQVDDWQSILLKRFFYNELVQERFDFDGYMEDYSGILEKDLDY